MSPLRYKTLLTFLPGMASVVNTFNSPQVQSAVYELLIEALDSKLEAEGMGRSNAAPGDRPVSKIIVGELAHDLIEGESIHADQSRHSRAGATVF